MTQQTVQELTKSKKFGRYDVLEYKYARVDEIRFKDRISLEITNKLNNTEPQEIMFLHKVYYDNDTKSKAFYHVKDSTIIFSEDERLCSLCIFNQNSNKRQETRKFLKEILS